MLLPDGHALWLVAFLLVIFSRDFTAPFLPLFVIFQVTIWMTSSANQYDVAGGVPAELSDAFDFQVRRVSYMTYGAISGIILSVAMGNRVLIPLHSFSKRRVHLAGPLSILAVAYGTYALAVVTGLVNVFADFVPSEPGQIVFFSIVLGLLALLQIVIVYTTWTGNRQSPWYLIFAYRYRDDRTVSANIGLMSSRAIILWIAVLFAAVAPHTLWIYISRPPVDWPQLAGGAFTIFLEACVWIAVYYKVHMEPYPFALFYFSTEQSSVTAQWFCIAVGGIQIGSSIAYVIAAEFFGSGLSQEIILIITTGVVLCVALIVHFWAPAPTIHSAEAPMYDIAPAESADGNDDMFTNDLDDAESMFSPASIASRQRELGVPLN